MPRYSRYWQVSKLVQLKVEHRGQQVGSLPHPKWRTRVNAHFRSGRLAVG